MILSSNCSRRRVIAGLTSSVHPLRASKTVAPSQHAPIPSNIVCRTRSAVPARNLHVSRTLHVVKPFLLADIGEGPLPSLLLFSLLASEALLLILELCPSIVSFPVTKCSIPHAPPRACSNNVISYSFQARSFTRQPKRKNLS